MNDAALPGEEGASIEWGERELKYMRQALGEAWRAYERQEVPVGCVVVRDGAVVARGSNRTNELRNATRHAEFEAVDAVLAASGGDVAAAGFDRCELFVTCEPCIMCAGALSTLRFAKVRVRATATASRPAATCPSGLLWGERGTDGQSNPAGDSVRGNWHVNAGRRHRDQGLGLSGRCVPSPA
jgi:tRNA(Arg) A34 adenosine deaminase TadA